MICYYLLRILRFFLAESENKYNINGGNLINYDEAINVEIREHATITRMNFKNFQKLNFSHITNMSGRLVEN